MPIVIKYLLEEKESREALNLESLCDGLVLSGVNLGNVVRRVVLSQALSSLGVLGGE